MYRNCVTEISVRHQRQVEDALLALMTRQPFGEISVKELCEVSGVTRRVFYHLFSNKQGALLAMIDHRLLAIESYCPEISSEVLRFFRYWQNQKDLLDVLLANQLTGLLLERLIAIVMNENYDLRNWVRRKGWEEDREVLVYHLTGTMALVYSWYSEGFVRTAEEMTALLKKIASSPLEYGSK